MGILDGQAVSAAITNPAFISKNQDDVMPNKLGLSRTLSGTSIADVQATLNKLYTATGASESQTGTTYNATPSTITNGDSYEFALKELAGKFDPATGHFHTGAAGDGPILNVVRTAAASGFTPAFGNIVFSPGSGIYLNQSGPVITVSSTVSTTFISATGYTPLSGSIVLKEGFGVQLSQSGQYITIAATGAGGGGGGGSLSWIENVDSPTPLFENNIEVYGFDYGLSQSLYTNIKVPNSYGAGSPVKMRTEFYSPDSSGTVLFQTISTLIRTGTDLISSLTNQRTSTNTAVTLGAGTVNIPQAVTLDLSNSTGQINGVAISAGDTIIVQLTRGTDTATSQARHMSFATETSFT